MTEVKRPALLDPARHVRDRFDSGEPSLDDWLRRYAAQNRKRDTAATWVITDRDGVVLAYTAIAMTGVDRSAAPAPLAKQAPDPVPALLIGRLAVDRHHTGLGLGSALVAHVLTTAIKLNQTVACRAVIATALNESARAWWRHLGFRPFDLHSFDLDLLTAEIQATIRAHQN